MNKLFLVGEAIVAVVSLTLFAKLVPSPWREIAYLPVWRVEKKLRWKSRVLMAKLLLPMFLFVFLIGFTLDRLKISLIGAFTSALFVLWLLLLVPLYLAVFRERKHGYLKLLALGAAWTAYFICLAASVGKV